MFARAFPRCLLVFLAPCLALLSAGCATTQQLAAGAPLHVVLTEYRIRPSHVVVPDRPLTLIVSNYGRLSHDLVLTDLASSRPVADSGGLTSGRTVTRRLHLAPGIYRMSSNIAIDQSVQQQGTLTVASK